MTAWCCRNGVSVFNSVSGTNGALGTALPAQAWPCVVLGSGGEAQLMRWARSLQVVTCSGRHGGLWAPEAWLGGRAMV